MIVGAIHGTDPEYGVPVFRGRRARRALVALFGLTNAAPTTVRWNRLGPRALIPTPRLVFVDDWKDGQPQAVWVPEAPSRPERGGF